MVDVIVTTLGGRQTARSVKAGGGIVGIRSSENPPDGIQMGFIDWPFQVDNPSLDRHIEMVEQFEPTYAVVPDIEKGRTLQEAVEIGDRLADHAENTIIVPKDVPVSDVPDRFLVGMPFRDEWDTDTGVNEFHDFRGRPVHILGGNPTQHFEVQQRFQLDVTSVDTPNPLAWADAGRVWVADLGGANGVRFVLVQELVDRSHMDEERVHRRVKRDLIEATDIDAPPADFTLKQLLDHEAVKDLSPSDFIRAVGAQFLQEMSASIENVRGVPTFRRLLESRGARITFTVMNLREAWNEGGVVTREREIAPGRGPPPPAPEGLHGRGREEVEERFVETVEEEEVGRVEPTERGLATFGGGEGETTKDADREAEDMATSDEACKRAVMASQEVILEQCADLEGSVEEISEDVFAFIPRDRREEFDFDLNDPQTEEELAQAIESCMESTVAREWADAVVGEDAPPEADERARRRYCEGLFG